ncbi:MAG TPA: alpha/beta hydrolase [Cytophagaceae bacterium]
MNRYYWILGCLFVLTGCFRLDDNLFNEKKLTSYELENYSGEKDIVLDASYAIPDSLIHIFTLQSQAPEEKTPTTIYAIYIGDINTIHEDTVILYNHGNKWHMDFYWQRAKLLANVGGKNRFGVMMIDYRGYGLSQGNPSEEGLYADVNAAVQWLKDRGLTGEQLVMYGFSLGSAPSTELTANPAVLRPEKLILEAPFASAEVMVQDGALIAMPGSYFTSLKIDNAEEIKKVNQPFLWIHGTKDDFLSYDTHGKVVFKNYKGVKGVAVPVEGGKHDNVPAVYGFEAYIQLLEKFITE